MCSRTPPWPPPACAKWLTMAGKKQIVVNLENDDPSSEDAFFIVEVIERAKNPWLRALPDFCNSMLLDKGADYNYRAVTAMFQNALTICHVKEIESDNGKLFRVNLEKDFLDREANRIQRLLLDGVGFRRRSVRRY